MRVTDRAAPVNNTIRTFLSCGRYSGEAVRLGYARLVFHVLTITYLQDADVVGQARPAHLAWLEDEVTAGRLILTGRLESGTGGVLITSDISTADAEALIARDPYHLQGLVRYDRVGFTAGRRAPGL
ncbi:MAG: cyclohydrolase [Mycobacterium sp.]|nr:cyclohydrolase [Mycobacterium sp.]MDT5176663.1 hypothetical protein [Mycobacterium sp.]